MTTEKPKILLVLDKETLKKVDNYWQSRQLKNRSEAIRELIEKGLKSTT